MTFRYPYRPYSFMRTLEELQSDLDYRFNSAQLLTKALTHSSHARETNAPAGDNEQLEFLGDAILGFLTSDFLCRAHPRLTEGQLSKLKGFLVSSANLVKFSEQLDLGDYLHLGKGEEKTGGRAKQALLVDAFEAILGAMYVDGGLNLFGGCCFDFSILRSGTLSIQPDRFPISRLSSRNSCRHASWIAPSTW